MPLAQEFERDGFVRIPGFATADEVALLTRAIEEAPERDPGPNELTLGTMRFASNLFYASPTLARWLSSEPVAAVVAELVGPDAWVRWDQAVWKQPGAPTFPLHQDNGYTGLRASHLQLWLALTAMDESNGGLLVCPGAHRGDFAHRAVGHHMAMEDDLATVALPAQAGDLIAFSSRLPHATGPNRTGSTRLAYVAEYLPLDVPDASVPWPHLVAVRHGRPDGTFVAAPGVDGAPSPSGAGGGAG